MNCRDRKVNMPAKKSAISQDVYQIKVTLLDTRPPVWRRLLVPAELTLGQLHDVLQLAFGWQNCHMHDFRIGRERFGEPEPDDGGMGLETSDERKARLSSVLGKAGAKAVYTYDFGDSWEHDIVVEKVQPADPGLVYPLCTAGKRRGPPEDCGGVPGYYNLLEAIRDPKHEEHEDMLEWIGGDFDPEAFSIEDVNRELAHLRGARRRR